MEWHYAVGDERRGPVDENTLGTLIGSGVVQRDSLVWRSGMSDWAPASSTPLSKFFPERAPAMARPRPNPLAPSPYAPPAAPLGEADRAFTPGAIEHRGVAFVVIMSIVTLGFFWFYLSYQWAKDVNTLLGHEKHTPVLPPLLAFLTCGIAGVVYACLFGFDLEQAAKQSGLSGRTENFGAIILALEIGGVVVGLATGGLLGWVCGVIATGLMQAELNKFATQAVSPEYAA